jgi:hypothetical protein
MQSVLIKSLAWASALTTALVGLAVWFVDTYVPISDGKDSDLRGAGAIIYYSPYLFSILALVFLIVGSIGQAIRNRWLPRSALRVELDEQ